MQRAADGIAEEDVDQKITASFDELGAMAQSFEAMLGYLRERGRRRRARRRRRPDRRAAAAPE